MKIGILTHQYINNYGAFLQAWALRKAISELFPEDEVQIIDYVNVKHYIINIINCWKSVISCTYKYGSMVCKSSYDYACICTVLICC